MFMVMMMVMIVVFLFLFARSANVCEYRLREHGEKDNAKDRQRNEARIDIPGQLTIGGFCGKEDAQSEQ